MERLTKGPGNGVGLSDELAISPGVHPTRRFRRPAPGRSVFEHRPARAGLVPRWQQRAHRGHRYRLAPPHLPCHR